VTKPEPRPYTYDGVLDNATQEQVYGLVEPYVLSVLDGYNATVFAYGYALVLLR
jgi:hypothetical protein